MIRFLHNAALGALSVFAFAPHHHAWLIFLTLGWFFSRVARTTTAQQAARDGFAFGLGFFGLGISWIHIALHTFGHMPLVLAGLATALLVAYMALWPALAAWAARSLFPAQTRGVYLALAFCFVATEWLRGVLFTGFPWLNLGTSQVGHSALAGYAPFLGGYGVSLAVCLVAAAIAWAWPGWRPRLLRGAGAAVFVLLLVAVGNQTGNREWSVLHGTPINVSLVQGNVLQEDKFRPEALAEAAARHLRLAASAQGPVVVLPETAFPMLKTQIPANITDALSEIAKAKQGNVVYGSFVRDLQTGHFHNAAHSVGLDPAQEFRKSHLVPFGEYLPGSDWLSGLYAQIAIPMTNQTPGPKNQAPFTLNGQKFGLSICYEDAYGSAVGSATSAPHILLNLTNDAWYGRSWAAEQHLQIAQLRAAEFSRPMLRATNTGMTAAIDHKGHVSARLPWFTEGVLEVRTQGRSGDTFYARWSELPILILCLPWLFAAIGRPLKARLEARRG